MLWALVERNEIQREGRKSYCDISEHRGLNENRSCRMEKKEEEQGWIRQNLMGTLNKQMRLQGPQRAVVRWVPKEEAMQQRVWSSIWLRLPL